jgi:hypothetical protein
VLTGMPGRLPVKVVHDHYSWLWWCVVVVVVAVDEEVL